MPTPWLWRPGFPYHVLHGCNVVFSDCRECWTRARRIFHTSDAVLELLSSFIHLCTTHTPVTTLNPHPTMNLYRFHAFAKQTCHNTSLLLLSAPLQGHRHLVELFPRFLCVPQACQRHLLVALGHPLRIHYAQWHRSYTRFLIELFRFPTERTLYTDKLQYFSGRRRHEVNLWVSPKWRKERPIHSTRLHTQTKFEVFCNVCTVWKILWK